MVAEYTIVGENAIFETGMIIRKISLNGGEQYEKNK